MNKPNGVCFLVKKKRFRRSVETKRKPIDENQGHKGQENFQSKRERNIEDSPKKNKNCYKVLECAENRIILLKPAQKIKNHQTIKSKMTSDEGLLDFDQFLYEYFKSDNEEAQTSPPKQKPLKTLVSNKPKCKDKLKQRKRDNILKKRNKVNEKEDIYNINNFIIHPNQIKITQKQDPDIKILTPLFKNLEHEENFSIHSFSSVEDTSDQYYLKLHDEFEKQEISYRYTIFEDSKKKKTRTDKLYSNFNHPHSTRQNLDSSNTETSESNFKFRIDIDNN